MISMPLGTALGGPLVGSFGAAETLAASGAATVLPAVAGTAAWSREHASPAEQIP
jgi:hypothetical protein